MNDRSAEAAVTGAGGSLGSALVRRLLERGIGVRGLVRSDEDALRLERLGAQHLRGDVRDTHTLETLVAGCRLVFHLASWTGRPFDETLARDVNIEATRDLLSVAAQAGVERVLLASSIAVYGPVQDGRIDENTPYWSVGDLYGDTKIEAERIARSEAERLGIELVVLQPTMIYGPRSPSWTLVPFEAISRGLPVIIGSGDDLADPVYVEDVARAFELAAFAPAARVAGEQFIVGGDPVPWKIFLGHYAAMAGTRLRRLPAGLARGGAAIAGVSRIVGRRPQLLPEMVGVMTSRATFSWDKAHAAFGYAPQTPLEQGMRETAAGLRQQGLVRSPSVALVTGAASGLGRMVARGLHDRGVTVWAGDLDADALEDLDSGIHTLALDVTSQDSIDAVLATIRSTSGAPDLLVNVAGLAKPGALEAQNWQDVELQFEVNAYGPLRLARAVAPFMRQRGYGRILNVSSTNGFLVTPFMGAYSASKYALEALSDSLRLELSPWKVDVVLIEPGAMKTPFADRAKQALQREAENSGEWRSYLERFNDSSMWGTGSATDPAKVAAVIVKTAFARRVGPRVLATAGAVPARAIALLPAAITDALFRRLSGLHRAPAPPADSSEKAATPQQVPTRRTDSR